MYEAGVFYTLKCLRFCSQILANLKFSNTNTSQDFLDFYFNVYIVLWLDSILEIS